MDAREVLAWLQRKGSQRNVAGMARYGIVARKAFGVSMATMQPLARKLGRDHALALALWRTQWHEARLLAALIDDPARVTRAQMNAWAGDFENWAICDTTCMHLFDRCPHAWDKARQWTGARRELVRRAGFALMASLAAHDKQMPDAAFLALLPLIEEGAGDERNFVKKAVSWALRAVGQRSAVLNEAALRVARRLAASSLPAPRWVGKDALRQLSSAKVQARLAERERRAALRRRPARR